MSILTRPKRKIKPSHKKDPTVPAHELRRDPEAPDRGTHSAESEAPDAGESRINVYEGDFTHGRSQS